MPTLQFQLNRQPVTIIAPDAALLGHYAEYFRYYAVEEARAESAAQPLTLALRHTSVLVFPAVEQLEKLAETGIVSLWRSLVAPVETLWLRAGDTTFEICPATGCATGYLDAEAVGLPPILTNTYSLFALLLLLRWRGVYHLHAAAVLTPAGQCCWLAGAQRSGKTTLVTALGLAGWQPLADDSLLLEWRDGQAVWQPLRKAFHVGLDALAHWQTRCTGLMTQPRYLERHSVAALEFFRTQTLAEQTFSTVEALLFPQVQAARLTAGAPLAPSEALRRLAEQSTFFPLWRKHTNLQFQALSHFASNAKSFNVVAGADVLDEPERVAAKLRTLLSETSRTHSSRHLF